jgi:hypothetical protein
LRSRSLTPANSATDLRLWATSAMVGDSKR